MPIGVSGSNSSCRRRQRTCAPHRHFAAFGFQLVARSRRAGAFGRSGDRRRARDLAARSLRREQQMTGCRRSRSGARAGIRAAGGPADARAGCGISAAAGRAARRSRPRSASRMSALADAASGADGGKSRARILRPVHRHRPRRVDALRLLLSHRLPARAPAGAAARGSWRSSASSAPRANTNRKITPPSCARSCPGSPAATSRRRPAPTGNCSRSIWRPGLAVSSPISSAPKPRTSTGASERSAACSWISRSEAFALPS